MKNRKLILLFFIVLLAGFLRFFKISEIPPNLNWDEAAWGYNAYSIGIDGRDEFGKIPITYIKSYGDYKPPVYAYLDVIPVKVFGLNDFGVRFPSALLGTLTVLLTFFLIGEIFPKFEKKEELGIISAFFLAISPWHIMLSRAAFEANVATFLLISGIFLFLKAVNSNKYFLILSSISFALSIYTFNTSRIFAPLMGITLALIFRKKLLKEWKVSLISGVLLILILLPTAKFLVSPEAKIRFNEVNIFSDLSVIDTANQEVINDNNSIVSKVIHNRRYLYSLDFLKHYFDNLNPTFLFIKGDQNPRFSTKDLGEMYLLDLPLVVIGIFFIFKRKEGYYFILPIWILLGIIPAATARETPHALRIETIIPTLQILSAFGFLELITYFKNKKYIPIIFGLILFMSFVYFYHGLVFHYSREYSQEWQYTYKESVAYVESVKNEYDHISFTNFLGRPYIYFLIYEKKDPREFRNQALVTTDIFGFVNVQSFDKFYFSVDPNNPPFSKNNTLFVVDPRYVPGNAKVLKKFSRLDGTVELVAYKL